LNNIAKLGVTGTALAAHLDCTRETISDYLAKGLIAKLPNGRYDQDLSRNSVLKHLRDRAAGRTGNASDANLSTERALLAKEQRETVSLKNAISRGDYIELSVIKHLLIVMFAIIRERLLTLPGKMADTCEMRARGEIADLMRIEVTEILDELSDPTAGSVPGEPGRSGNVSGGRKRPRAAP
jgi:phage terminase Nu1 subunit (DNA packaging protein)